MIGDKEMFGAVSDMLRHCADWLSPTETNHVLGMSRWSNDDLYARIMAQGVPMTHTIRHNLIRDVEDAPEGQIARLRANDTIASAFDQIVDNRLDDFDAFYLLIDVIDRLNGELEEVWDNR